eukprot:s3700_g11.t1
MRVFSRWQRSFGRCKVLAWQCKPLTCKRWTGSQVAIGSPDVRWIDGPPATNNRKPLPMRLNTLEGPAWQFVKLQAALRERQREERASHAFEDVHQQLASLGILQAERLQDKIGSYLAGTDIQVIEDLDEHLLAVHGILMEDLSAERLQQFLEDPSIFDKDSETLEEIRKQLYGRGRMPILTAEAQVEACVHHELSWRRREFAIEHLAETAALREFLEEQKVHADAGRGALTGGTKRLWMPWVEAMSTVLSDGKAVQRKGAGSRTFITLTTLGLEPELLAIITCQNVLNLLMLPCFRNKDEMQANARQNRFGEVPFTTAATRVGEAVEDELMWQRIVAHETMKPQLLEMRRLRQAFRDRTKSLPIGAALVDLLIDCSALRVPAMHIDSKVVADGLPDGAPREELLEKALVYGKRRETRTKVVGYLSLHPLARAKMESEGDMLHFIKPKMQPMVIPPLPWQPCGDSPQGPYILHKSAFVRTTSEQMTQLRSYSASRSAGTMDFLGRVPWRINGRILALIREAQQRDLAIAGIPPNEDPPVPPVPDQSDPDYQVLRLRRLNAEKRCRELRSERPTFELKLRSAEDFVNAEKLYFPHNMDFRGRCYPLPPHLNHMGDDLSRGLLMFSDSKPLGSEGLFWSKVGIANLHGKNKISLEDRVRWVDNRKDIIMQVAENPLSPESIEHWADADDGPWQVLARYLELAEVYRRPGAEEEFRSHLPVHVDGSCNGLQHYAALGRDLAGGEAVNLTPNDKPQDVYTVVLKIVIDKVKADAALPVHVQTEAQEGRPLSHDQGRLARRLLELDILQRKVVKQTIMTICYGVTAERRYSFLVLAMSTIDDAAGLLRDAEWHIDEEESQLAEQKAQKALSILRENSQDSPGPADAVRMLSLACSARGDRKAGLGLLAQELSRGGCSHRQRAVLRLAFAEIANSRCGSKRREEALEAALEAVETFRELGEQRLEGWALIALAHTHVQKGTKSEVPEELTKALEAAAQAQVVLREVGDRVGEGKAMHTTAVALSFQNNIDEAVARSRELVSYWRDLGYTRLEAFQQECVSEWELVRHRPEEALEAAQAALEQKMQREAQRQAQVDPVPARSAAALIHASNAYLTMGKTDEALKLSQERLETFRRNRDFESEIVAQSSIVSVYVNSGRLRQAAEVAEETLRKVQSRPSSRLLKCWEIDLLQTLAKIYLRAEDVENAEKIVDQTIAVASEQKDRKSLAAAYLLQSELALLRKENRLGLKAAMRSRDLSRKTQTKKGEASALLQLCSAYCARGELKRGAAVTVESQRIFNSVGDREGEADALRMQAEVRLHLNDFPRAIAAARRCRELQREMGDRKSEAWACVQLAQTLLSAASDEEKQELDLRAKAKEEKARSEGKVLESADGTGTRQDWFHGDDEDDNQERPAKAAFERALQAAKDALQLSRPQEDEQLLSRALLSLATAQMMCLEADAAAKSIEEGLPVAQTVADASAEAHFLLVKSQLAEFNGAKSHPEAKQLANEALQLFTTQRDESGEAAAQAILKRLTPKTIGVRPTDTGGPRYYSAEGDDEMEEYWEEEVIEEGGGGGGPVEIQPYSGPNSSEIVATVSDVALSLIGVETLDADEPLMDAGLDSLAAVEFGNTLAKEFSGVALPSTLMFDFPSVKLLSGFIDASMREAHDKSEAQRAQSAAAGGGGGGGQRRTRMVKKFRPKPGGARRKPMSFNQQAPVQMVPAIPQAAPGQAGQAVSQAAEVGPYKGPTLAEIEEVVKDTALSLIGVESLDNDEPLMDAGLDSLAAVEFGNAIQKDFVGLTMPNTLMFDYPSVKRLTEFINEGLIEAHGK